MNALDNPVTFRQLLLKPLSLPPHPILFDEYMNLPRGYHASRESDKRFTSYTWAWTDITGHAVACITVIVGFKDNGLEEVTEQRLAIIEGSPLFLRPVRGEGYPHGFEVAEGSHAGTKIAYRT